MLDIQPKLNNCQINHGNSFEEGQSYNTQPFMIIQAYVDMVFRYFTIFALYFESVQAKSNRILFFDDKRDKINIKIFKRKSKKNIRVLTLFSPIFPHQTFLKRAAQVRNLQIHTVNIQKNRRIKMKKLLNIKRIFYEFIHHNRDHKESQQNVCVVNSVQNSALLVLNDSNAIKYVCI